MLAKPSAVAVPGVELLVHLVRHLPLVQPKGRDLPPNPCRSFKWVCTIRACAPCNAFEATLDLLVYPPLLRRTLCQDAEGLAPPDDRPRRSGLHPREAVIDHPPLPLHPIIGLQIIATVRRSK